MRIGLRHGNGGRFFPFGKEAVIGSAEGVDILLDDSGVAEQHAKIRISGAGIELDHMADGKETIVNSYKIGKHFLSRDDKIRIGEATLTLEIEAGDTPPGTVRCRRCGTELDPAHGASPIPRGSGSGFLCTHCSAIPKKSSSRHEAVADRRTETPPILPDATTKKYVGSSFAAEWLEAFAPIGVLGEGSQGRVYKLRNKQTGQVVAGKRLWALSPKALARFEREIEAQRRLKHHSIIELIEVRRSDSSTLLVMEFVDGPSLANLVKKEGRLDPKRAIKMAAHLASALTYAATQNVIHRDVKPSNILVSSQDVPKLADFGLVTFNETRTRLTAEGQWIGTPHYMAPEQVDGAECDGRTDVWGLAATFLQAMTAATPFEATTPTDLFRKILRDPIDLSKLEAVAGPEVAKLFGRFFTKAVNQRPQPDEAMAELERLAKSMNIDLTLPSPGAKIDPLPASKKSSERLNALSSIGASTDVLPIPSVGEKTARIEIGVGLLGAIAPKREPPPAPGPAPSAEPAAEAQNPELLLRRARLLLARGDPSGAKDLCDEAIRLAPAHADAYALRGQCREKLGQIKGANEDRKKASDFRGTAPSSQSP